MHYSTLSFTSLLAAFALHCVPSAAVPLPSQRPRGIKVSGVLRRKPCSMKELCDNMRFTQDCADRNLHKDPRVYKLPAEIIPNPVRNYCLFDDMNDGNVHAPARLDCDIIDTCRALDKKQKGVIDRSRRTQRDVDFCKAYIGPCTVENLCEHKRFIWANRNREEYQLAPYKYHLLAANIPKEYRQYCGVKDDSATPPTRRDCNAADIADTCHATLEKLYTIPRAGWTHEQTRDFNTCRAYHVPCTVDELCQHNRFISANKNKKQFMKPPYSYHVVAAKMLEDEQRYCQVYGAPPTNGLDKFHCSVDETCAALVEELKNIAKTYWTARQISDQKFCARALIKRAIEPPRDTGACTMEQLCESMRFIWANRNNKQYEAKMFKVPAANMSPNFQAWCKVLSNAPAVKPARTDCDAVDTCLSIVARLKPLLVHIPPKDWTPQQKNEMFFCDDLALYNKARKESLAAMLPPDRKKTSLFQKKVPPVPGRPKAAGGKKSLGKDKVPPVLQRPLPEPP